MREDTAGRVHREKYGKSDKFNAPENQNREFPDGYSTGVDSLGFDAQKLIEEKFLLRVEVDDDLGKGFEEWKRGFWAARNQPISSGKRKPTPSPIKNDPAQTHTYAHAPLVAMSQHVVSCPTLATSRCSASASWAE